MIKFRVLSVFMLCSICCFGQDWVEVKVDDRVSVQLPSDYQRGDTLNTVNFWAQTDACGFLVSQLVFSEDVVKGTTIRNDKHLYASYVEIVDGYKEKGMQVDRYEIVDWNEFMIVKLYMRVLGPTGDIWQEGWQLVFADRSYFFLSSNTQEWAENPILIEEKEAFFNGIKIDPLITRKNQYNFSGYYYKLGELVGTYLPHALTAFVIGIVFFLQWRKKKRAARAAADSAAQNL